MRRLVLPSAVAVCLGSLSAAQPPDRDAVVRYAADSGESLWQQAQNPPGGLESRVLFAYALALCEAKVRPERVERLLTLARQMQDRDPKSGGYGNFRWRWSEDRVLDYNAVDFCMASGSVLLLRHQDDLPPAALDLLRNLVTLGAEGCRVHKVPESYTNIALMNAADLILLGEGLARPDLADEGYQRLDRICLYTWECGLHEYDSPTYYGVDLDSLGLLEAFCRRERGREQAAALLELFWTDLALNWFPGAQKLGGAHSRDYDYVAGLGSLDVAMWYQGWLPGEPRGGPGAILPALSRWRPAEKLRALNARLPRLVRQAWGLSVAESRTQCLLPDVTLSVSGARYSNMDIPLSVDLAGDRTSPRCYFIADGRRDPYGKQKIPAGNQEKTLHLTPFWAGAQNRRDVLALAIYRPGDIPPNTELLQSHFVLPRQVDGFWIGDKPVRFQEGAPASFVVRPGDPLILRRGTAAVGVKVPWTQGLAGGPVPATLVYDGNQYGVVRLTVAHGARGIDPPLAVGGIALWVRIAGGLTSDQAFDEWRRAFVLAQPTVTASPSRVSLHVQGLDGPVTVAAESPFETPALLEPAPSRAVLELDGEDVGRRILHDLEPIRSVQAQQAVSEPITVSPDHGVYFEAEDGVVMPPMETGYDEKASGGKYVWMPGNAGEAGGSGLGSVTWRLQIAQAGTYVLWGRVLAPTPNDDSFYARVFTDAQELIPLATWQTGIHRDWEWVRVRLGEARSPVPLALAAGPTNLQLRVREDGTKIDRLFITGQSGEEPR